MHRKQVERLEIVRIISFLVSGKQNAWLSIGPLNIFVRRSLRRFAGKTGTALDLANMEMKEEYRGKGLFTKLTEDLERELKARGDVDFIYIESVLNKRLKDRLERDGWRSDPAVDPITPSFFKVL